MIYALIIFVLLIIIGIFIYQLYMANWDFSKINWRFWETAEDIIKKKTGSGEIKEPCVFLENDIVSGDVHDKYGRRLRSNKKIDCSQCGDYVYKGITGCSNYQKDFMYTIKERSTGENMNVCSALSFPRKCIDVFKSPPQNE